MAAFRQKIMNFNLVAWQPSATVSVTAPRWRRFDPSRHYLSSLYSTELGVRPNEVFTLFTSSSARRRQLSSASKKPSSSLFPLSPHVCLDIHCSSFWFPIIVHRVLVLTFHRLSGIALLFLSFSAEIKSLCIRKLFKKRNEFSFFFIYSVRSLKSGTTHPYVRLSSTENNKHNFNPQKRKKKRRRGRTF